MSPLLYVLVVEDLGCNIRANPSIWGLSLCVRMFRSVLSFPLFRIMSLVRGLSLIILNVRVCGWVLGSRRSYLASYSAYQYSVLD